MNIRPTPSHPSKTTGAGADRLADAQGVPAAPDRAREADAQAPPKQDRVELSIEARALESSRPDAAAESTLPPERLRQILERLASGHYDRPEVTNAVVRAVADELGSVEPEDGRR